jgi:hypothetical protein
MVDIGDRVTTGKYCGIEGMVTFWDYEGILEKVWWVEDKEDFFMGEHLVQPAEKARWRARVIRDDGDWFVCDLDDLEKV